MGGGGGGVGGGGGGFQPKKRMNLKFYIEHVPHALHCVDWLLFCILPLLTVWFQCSLHLPPPSPPPSSFFFSFQIWILCQNSLTRELKIRVVRFALKKLFTHFEMLIVSHALHCVNGHYFVFYLF